MVEGNKNVIGLSQKSKPHESDPRLKKITWFKEDDVLFLLTKD